MNPAAVGLLLSVKILYSHSGQKKVNTIIKGEVDTVNHRKTEN